MPSYVESDPPRAAADIDQVIHGMERFYQAVTGCPPPAAEAGVTPIPVERDPGEYVDEQLNRLLELLGPDAAAERAAAAPPSFLPPLSVLERDEETVVRVDLPGVAREDVQVSLTGSVLTIAGTRNPAAGGDGFRMRVSECPAGVFRRVLELGAAGAADPTARLRDGVLEVRVARETPAPPRVRAVAVD